jgi:hypothetical protein
MTTLIAPDTEAERITAEANHRPTRSDLVLALIKRDGDHCRYCKRDFDKRERTIDHVYPQRRAYEDGWTYAQVWDLKNLALACKPCNARKSDHLLDENGNIPARKERTFRYRRDKRANRPDQPCVECDNGHNLFIDEVCAACGVSAQQYPRSAKVKAPDCDHAITWCWACSIGITERKGAIEMLFGMNGSPVEGQEEGLD